ncbi:zinc ribbon domain-containing protein [Paenibacillus dakarensis]|uniref:zinc ribbon domain-containing protein n=1 Tax=Paenibacillus dakarensis TaxID=1527293 RepID=UPI0006D58757|nr:zinc ribbon domain-containing protein [Paenibacillus dakarensis]
MICKICGHENEGGKFCEKCGAKLGPEVEETSAVQSFEGQEASETEVNTEIPAPPAEFRSVQNESAAGEAHHHVFTAPPRPQATTGGTAGDELSKPNPYIESAKQNSKVYFDYFLKGLKSPLAVTQKTGSEQLLNGIISLAIFVILFPLMFYFSLGHEARSFLSSSPFVDFVLKPAFWLAVFMFLVAVYTFGAVKLSTHPGAHFKEIIARFGVMLIPFIVISLIAFLFIILGSSVGGAFLTIGLIGGIFTIPALITTSYKRVALGGLDTLYAILLIYVAIFLTMLIVGDSIGSMLRPERIFNF